MDFALVELLVSFGVVLALAVWELVLTPRPDRGEPDDSADEPDPPQA